MAGLNSGNMKRAKYITVDGQQIRPIEAVWVRYDPEGKPVDAFPSTLKLLADEAAAARSAWFGSTGAIKAMNAGWRIEIMTQRRYLAEIAPQLAARKDVG